MLEEGISDAPPPSCSQWAQPTDADLAATIGKSPRRAFDEQVKAGGKTADVLLK